MKFCPYCGEEINDSAKKCRFCNEWLNKDVSITEKSLNKKFNIIDFFIDNRINITVISIILYLIINTILSKINNIGENHYLDNNIDKETFSLDAEVKNNNLYDSNEIEDLNIYQVKGDDGNIEGTKNGYILLKNTVGECELKGDKIIEDFVKSVNKAKVGEILKDETGEFDWKCNNKKEIIDKGFDRYSNDVYFIDNTYSKDQNGNVDKILLNQRLKNISNFINNDNYSDGSEIGINFMFTNQPDDDSEEPDGNFYSFTIDSTLFPIKYKKVSNGDGEIIFRDSRQFLSFKNNKIIATFGGIDSSKTKCISNNENEFVCYDANNVYEKIKEIYNKNFDSDKYHTENMFLKTLVTFKDRIEGEKENIYIFTDGEFKIGDEREKKYLSGLKNKYKTQRKHDLGVDKTHNMTEFTMRETNWYQKDEKYVQFWDDTITILKQELPKCSEKNVYIIGLSRSAEYTKLAEKIYDQIFSPCYVTYK